MALVKFGSPGCGVAIFGVGPSAANSGDQSHRLMGIVCTVSVSDMTDMRHF